MKISLITIKGLYNYGAVLQGFATYEYLKKLNFDVEVIDYFPEYFESDTPLFKRAAIQLLTIIKRHKIRKFVRSNVRLTNETYTSFKKLKNNPPESDVYLVGSDQVWNSQLSGGHIDPAYFLDFIDNKKKVSFASSIGRTDVHINELQEMKEYLNKFSHISVREESAKQLLESVGVKNVINVLDPVFLLQQEDYKQFIKTVKYKKYLLIYSFEKNSLIEKLALEISKKMQLQIIEIGIFASKYTCDKYIQNAGVEDFLSLIYNADFVITSSFHGTAFSIILNKQFISVSPSVRKTRLENITNLFELKSRLISEEDNYIVEDLLLPIDYANINKIVEVNSEKSRNFIKNSII